MSIRAFLSTYLRDDIDSLGALATSESAYRAARPSVGAAAASSVAAVARLPRLRLLSLPPQDDTRAFVQSFDDTLYVRVQGFVADRVVLRRDQRTVALHPVRNSRPFALPYLNGTAFGTLWVARATSSTAWFAPGAPLSVQVRTAGLDRLYGPVHLRPPGRATRYDRDFTRALRAWAAEDGAGFASALACLARQRDRWRVLTPSQNLWLSALFAELERAGLGPRWGADAFREHPQRIRR